MNKAIVIRRNGGPSVLKLEDQRLLKPRQNEVQVKVLACGVNFIDIYQRSGLYKIPLPYVPGGEMCGDVVAVGTNVSLFKVGDRVATATAGSGCYAQMCNVSES